MDIQFLGLRTTTVLLTLVLLATLDLRYRPAKQSTERKLVYSGILGCGLAGSLFGGIMDQITYTLSPEYFTLWKELPGESESMLRLRALELGTAAGLVPGLIAGICFVVAALYGRLQGKIRHPQLLYHLAIPAATILVCSSLMGWIHYWSPDSRLVRNMSPLVQGQELQWMNAVWGIHKAAYLGGFVGTVLATIVIAKRKKP